MPDTIWEHAYLSLHISCHCGEDMYIHTDVGSIICPKCQTEYRYTCDLRLVTKPIAILRKGDEG
jgi:hypothetical protein